MASYLSYFTSNSSAAPTQQQYSQAQPATSTWANTFSSRIATLRKALTKDSEEDDPDNEDCSHVSNVLRAYYTQKGRPFPEWLPPDPKKPQPIPQMQQPYDQYRQYGQYGQHGQYGNQYGQSTHSRGQSGGGLSDLWDSAPAPAQQRPAPQSLRAPRPTPQSLRSADPGGRGESNLGPSNEARPLPSQRAGSSQNAPPATAQVMHRNRVLARVGGGGSGRNSPVPNQPSQKPYGDPGYSDESAGNTGADPYGSPSQPWSSGSGGYDNYTSAGNYANYGNSNYRQRSGGPR